MDLHATVSRLEKRVDVLEQENAAFKQENALIQQENAVFKQENAVFKQRISALEKENAVIKQENAVVSRIALHAALTIQQRFKEKKWLLSTSSNKAEVLQEMLAMGLISHEFKPLYRSNMLEMEDRRNLETLVEWVRM